LVELLTAILFAGAAIRFGYDWSLPAVLVFLAGLLALAFTDLEQFLLPVRIVYPMLGLIAGLLVVAAAATGAWSRLAVAVACGAFAFAIFFGLNFVNPKWMGFGDVRLSLVIGLALGWLGAGVALLGFFLSFLLGSVVGVTLILAKRIEHSAPIPFGVFLATGASTAVYFGRPLIDLYLRH
jgi:leader peptidase (prepilin peptidase)/N-methyltransferase